MIGGDNIVYKDSIDSSSCAAGDNRGACRHMQTQTQNYFNKIEKDKDRNYFTFISHYSYYNYTHLYTFRNLKH